MSLVTEMMSPQVAGLPIIPQIKLEEYLDDFVKGVNHMMIKDLIIPLLKSNNLSRSFVEIVQLHSAIVGSVGIIISARYKPTELVEILVKAYEELQKVLINLEPYLKENTVSALAGLDAQFEYSVGFLEILQKDPKHLLKIQLQQYLELASYASSLNLCLYSMISVAKGKVKTSEINKRNLRTLAQWSEHYASQLLIKAQKLGITDGNKLSKYLDMRKKVSDLLKEIES